MRLNDLNGKAWVKLSKSTWITQKLLGWCDQMPLQLDTPCVKQKPHPRKNAMNKPLPDNNYTKLIELLTQKGQTVFDPQLQEGAILRAALAAERNFVGIGTLTECEAIKKQFGVACQAKFIQLINQEDCPQVLCEIPAASIDLLLWNVSLFDFKQQAMSYDQYIEALAVKLKNCLSKLKPKAHVALVLADQRYQGRYYCSHANVIKIIEKISLALQGLINIIEDAHALKAYGYPSTYVPNIMNRFVVIARNNLSF